MIIKTSNLSSIQPFLKDFVLPKKDSHKGQNGKILIIGGSSLFHSASIWAAEVSSHFADIVHYSSVSENNEVMLTLKKKFQNGIVVSEEKIPLYIDEDDVILIGPGMMRGKNSDGEKTYALTKYVTENFPEKRFVFDAGALQTMDKNWLFSLKIPPILTPHKGEFKELFNIDLTENGNHEAIVVETARHYHSVILLKEGSDIISDGKDTYIIEGGNQGLTKGGTGDILAGLCASFYAKNNVLDSAVLASYVLKKTGDILFGKKGYWYNIEDILNEIPSTMKSLFINVVK